MPGGVRTEIHLVGEQTGGRFCLLADRLPAGWSLPAHRHPRADETIHVIEGAFEMELDGERTRLGPGETIFVPRGVIHAGANVGRDDGRRLVLFSPAGMERFFLEVGASEPGADVDWRALAAAAVREGWEIVPRRA